MKQGARAIAAGLVLLAGCEGVPLCGARREAPLGSGQVGHHYVHVCAMWRGHAGSVHVCQCGKQWPVEP